MEDSDTGWERIKMDGNEEGGFDKWYIQQLLIKKYTMYSLRRSEIIFLITPLNIFL